MPTASWKRQNTSRIASIQGMHFVISGNHNNSHKFWSASTKIVLKDIRPYWENAIQQTVEEARLPMIY